MYLSTFWDVILGEIPVGAARDIGEHDANVVD